MFKKTITYKDFNKNEQTETFWFNLSEAEVTKIEFEAVTSKTLGLEDMINQIIKDMKGKEMIAVVEDLIEKSYGVRSSDGKLFRKSAELYDDFKSSNAYAKFFFELVTDADFLVEWFNGLLPENLAEIAEEARRKAKVPTEPSLSARERSEAAMSGFKKKEEKVVTVPELATAAPVLQGSDVELSVAEVVANSPVNRPDLWPTPEAEQAEFLAWKSRQAALRVN